MYTEMYTDLGVWLGIVLGGIAGCFATGLFANWLKGVPVMRIAGNPAKHLWSIIFAVPIPLLFYLGGAGGIVLAFAWLMLVPTIASKLYFGPKDVPAMVLNAFHSGYALAALFAYVAVTWAMAIAIS